MKYNSVRVRLNIKLIILLLVVLLIYNFGYRTIHYYYLHKTNSEEFDIMRYNYFNQSTTQSEKNKIYVWFKVRGMGIDEGHNPDSNFEEWCYIFNYWRQK